MNTCFNVIMVGMHRELGPENPVKIEAHKMEVTACGALVFYKASGAIVRAFAPGAWKEVEGL